MQGILDYSVLVNVNGPFDLFFLWEIKAQMLIYRLHKLRSVVGWLTGINVPPVFPRSSKSQILGKIMKTQPLTKFGLSRSGFVFVHCLNHIQICGLERGWIQIVMVENLPLQGGFLGTHDSIRLNPIFLNAAEWQMCKFTLNKIMCVCVYIIYTHTKA